VTFEDLTAPVTLLLLPSPTHPSADMPIAKALKAIRRSKCWRCSEDATVHPSVAVNDNDSLSPPAKCPCKNAYPWPDTDVQIQS
jgi:hypothetical protein